MLIVGCPLISKHVDKLNVFVDVKFKEERGTEVREVRVTLLQKELLQKSKVGLERAE